eukprot:TRINITY_DN2004_c0_g1_i3.p1 TRINITY_DN2004_c0_g1~~TRINITY_DN2004_c0_g1_i3.p1  ORF type:complete len:1562 (+),score=556.38 TRINITY_DN2004_c0_g1_i3:268-4953(+)
MLFAVISSSAHIEPTAPTTSSTQVLCNIWEACLGYSPAKPSDDFFAKGGHLRAAARAVHAIRSVIVSAQRDDVTIDFLYLNRTPKALVSALGNVELDPSRMAWPSLQLPPRQADGRRSCTALASPSQLRMWLLQQQRPASWDYNIPAFFSVRGPVSAAQMRSAAIDAVGRHESLRTTLAMGPDGNLLQMVHSAEEAARWEFFETFDLRGLPASDRQSTLQRLVDERARTRFDCARGPLLRGFYAELDAERGCLGLVVHHAVFDGTSGAAIVREMALSALGKPVLAPTMQYTDFARWQLDQLASGACDRDFAYWQRQLLDVEPLPLPLDRPRSTNPVLRVSDSPANGRSIGFSWPAELSSRAATVAKQRGVTTYVLLAAAFSSVLQRWAGCDEVTLGTAMGGRSMAAFDGLCGNLVNTVVLRTAVDPASPFAELLQTMRRRVFDAFEHQAAPFEEVVRRLGGSLNREVGRHPIFDVFFVYQSGDAAPFFDTQTVGQLEISRDYWHGDVCQMDISLTMWRKDGKLAGSLEFNADLFDTSTMSRLLDNLRLFLEAALDNPMQPVGFVPILSKADTEKLNAFGLTPREGAASCIHELFEAQVRRTPDAVALDFEGSQQSTYRQLSARSNSLARRLRRLGVGSESLVGIYMDKSIEAYLSIFSVLKAGGCYTTLDPEHPADRTQFMLDDSRLRLVLTVSALLSKLRQALPSGGAVQVLALDSESDWESESSDALADVTVSPRQMAYMIYTSGTTGRPKGVCIEHRNVYNVHLNGAVNCGVGDRYFAFLALSFDPHMDDLRAALFNGGTLCFAARATMLNNLSGLLAQMEITHVAVTPSVAAVLDPALVLPCLRVLIVGGEPMTAALIAQWSSLVALYNIYGPTENTICCMTNLCRPETSHLNIGRPYVNCAAYILNEQLQPLPPGCIGELHFGGAQVARGYWQRPELTAEKFIRDPFRPNDPSARMLKTGDLARFMPDGSIECLGRRDTQVKLRGNRIELGEIESVLLAMPEVLRAAVVLQQLRSATLVAYVVPRLPVAAADEQRLVHGIIEHCRSRLTSYMVPTFVMLLPHLPLTTSGKLDTRALPKPAQLTPSASGQPRVGPRNSLERALWTACLQILPVAEAELSVLDDFFELGGHSLLAMQFVGKTRALYGDRLPLSLSMLFDLKTIDAMARSLSENGVSLDVAATAPLGAAADGALSHAAGLPLAPVRLEHGFECPASNGQARLWLIQQNEPSSNAYNVPSFFRFSGPLDLHRLQQCTTALVSRHEVLRTTVSMSPDGTLLQRVHGRGSDLALRTGRLAVSTGSASSLEDYVRSEAGAPFDLAAGPLVRFAVRTLTDGPGGVFSMVAHHATVDGWSCAVLLLELQRLWRPEPMPAVAVQYADFSEWQRATHTSAARLEASAGYWRDNLAGMQLLDLPRDHPRPTDGRTSPCGHVKLQLAPELVAQLDQLAARSNASMFMVFTAGLMAVLHRWSGEPDDVPLGAVLSGRTQQQLDSVVGFLANTVVLRGAVQPQMTFAALLEQVRSTVLAAMDHQVGRPGFCGFGSIVLQGRRVVRRSGQQT